jgi:hypothetical protein
MPGLREASPMIGFPLLLIPLAIYNIIVLLMPGVSFADPLLRLTLVSGAEWAVTLSDLLLVLGILMLLLEVFKGARPGAKYLTDHLLSLILFAAAAAEFVLWPKFGTSTYFLLVLLALTDFLSGVVLRTQRGMRMAQGAGAPLQRASRKADTPPAEPQFDPARAPAAPSAASVAESVLLDHPEPSLGQSSLGQSSLGQSSLGQSSLGQSGLGQPAAASNAASPEIPSPEIPSPKLQPGNGSHPSPEAPSH